MLYEEPTKFDTYCTCCGYRGEDALNTTEYIKLRWEVAYKHCPSCGYFTLREDHSKLREVMDRRQAASGSDVDDSVKWWYNNVSCLGVMYDICPSSSTG